MAVESQVKDPQALFTLDPVHGFLQFQDQEAFKQTLDYLFKHQASLDSFEASIPGFVSQRAAYNAIDTDEERMEIVNNPQGHPYRNFLVVQEGFDGELEAVRVVDILILSIVVDKNGLVSVGERVYKFCRNVVLSLEGPNKELVNELKYWEEGKEYPALTVSHRVTYRLVKSNSELEKLRGQCTSTYNKGLKLFRVKGEWREAEMTLNTISESKLYYFEGGSFHARRIAGIWFSDKADTLRVGAVGTVSFGGTTIANNVNPPIFNTNKNDLVVSFFQCFVCSKITSASFDATHRAAQGADFAQCNLSVSF